MVSITAFSQNWELPLNKDGIKVYTRNAQGSQFKEFKAEILIDASLKKLANEIMNVENYPQWCYKTIATKIFKREENKVYFYFLSDAPPIVKKREAYYCIQSITDEKTKTTVIRMNTVQNSNPIPASCVRIPVSNGIWTLTPVEENKTHILFEMQAEPGGIIPSWLANLVVEESPFVTLRNLRKVVTQN